jgi:hypothetical protein
MKRTLSLFIAAILALVSAAPALAADADSGLALPFTLDWGVIIRSHRVDVSVVDQLPRRASSRSSTTRAAGRRRHVRLPAAGWRGGV